MTVPGRGHRRGPAPTVLHRRKEQFQVLPNGEVGPPHLGPVAHPGKFVVYDWQSRQIIWQRSWGPYIAMPNGYCFADGVLYLNDMDGGGILAIDVSEQPGRLLRRITHPSFNDLHSIERTSRGFLVSCSGTDWIAELDLEGNVLYEWWATEHGYTTTASGHERASGRGQEHRDQFYHTRYHTTHLNEATFRDPDERYLLTVFFHQGQVVQIDRALPAEDQQPEVLLDGLNHPHGLKKTPFGWILVSSGTGEVLLLDDDFQVCERVLYKASWIQDCLVLSSGNILIIDSNASRVVELAGSPWQVVSVTTYPKNWRMGRLVEVPAEYADGFWRAGMSMTVVS